jgi:hypothetical protein
LVENKLLARHCEYEALSFDEESRRAAYGRLFDHADDPQFLVKAQLAASGRQLEPRKPGPAAQPLEPTPDLFSGGLQF